MPSAQSRKPRTPRAAAKTASSPAPAAPELAAPVTTAAPARKRKAAAEPLVSAPSAPVARAPAPVARKTAKTSKAAGTGAAVALTPAPTPAPLKPARAPRAAPQVTTPPEPSGKLAKAAKAAKKVAPPVKKAAPAAKKAPRASRRDAPAVPVDATPAPSLPAPVTAPVPAPATPRAAKKAAAGRAASEPAPIVTPIAPAAPVVPDEATPVPRQRAAAKKAAKKAARKVAGKTAREAATAPTPTPPEVAIAPRRTRKPAAEAVAPVEVIEPAAATVAATAATTTTASTGPAAPVAPKRRKRAVPEAAVEAAVEADMDSATEAVATETAEVEAPLAPAPETQASGIEAPAAEAPTEIAAEAPAASRRGRNRRRGRGADADVATPADTSLATVAEPVAEPAEAVEAAPAELVEPAPMVAQEPSQEPRSSRSRKRRRRGRGAEASAEPVEPIESAGSFMSTGADESPPDIEATAAQSELEPPADADATPLVAPAPAEPAAPALPPRPLLTLADPARFDHRPHGADALFGSHRVVDRVSGAAHEVTVRGLAEGENSCTCAAFLADDHGHCPHLDSVLAALLDQPDAHARLLAGIATAHSEVHLRWGAGRRIVWRMGSSCPAKLRALVAQALDDSGHLCATDPAALQRLLQRASELGHRVEVRDEVWAQLAEAHDAQRRVLALEAAYPDGPFSAELRHGLLRQPLARHQIEAALLAACAGRCVLADDAGLGKMAQALATLALHLRHFGAERVLIAVPAELLRRWQRVLARWTGLAARTGLDELSGAADAGTAGPGPDAAAAGIASPLALRIASLEEVTRRIDAVAAWAPDLLLVDEGPLDAPPWLGSTGAALQRLDARATVVVARTPLEDRPEALTALVRWLDPLRLGPTARLLAAHAGPVGADGQPSWHDLGQLGEALLPLVLRRHRAELVAQGTPELSVAIDDVHPLPLSAAQLARHQAERARAERLIARWDRHGDLASREQRELLTAVQGMRQACVAADLGQDSDRSAAASPKVDALLALIDEVSAHAPETQLVVFSQWEAALAELAQALAERGIGSLSFAGDLSEDGRDHSAEHFRRDPRCRLALVADAALPGLHLDHPGAGIVHLDRPWHPARLAERLAAVLPRDDDPAGHGRHGGAGDTDAQPGFAVTGVPVLHLVAEAGIEEALLDAPSDLPGAPAAPGRVDVARLLDHPAGGAFLSGAALASLIAQLRDVLQAIG